MATARISTRLPKGIISQTPQSAFSIPVGHTSPSNTNPNTIIHEVGTCRSLYLFNPNLTPIEMHGLSHRLKVMSRNSNLSSILVSFGDKKLIDEDGYHLPRSAYRSSPEGMTDWSKFHPPKVETLPPPKLTGVTYPLNTQHDVRTDDSHYDPFDSLTSLALCTRQDPSRQIVPVIFVPSGLITDGAYALSLLSHYTLCTEACSFRMDNPTKGLSFDPIGFSYMFNRLGLDYHQKETHELTLEIGRMISLMGYEADCWDWMATGMGTHVTSDSVGEEEDTLVMMEQNLAQLVPYAEQGISKKPIMSIADSLRMKKEGLDFEEQQDMVNRKYKNWTVEGVVEIASSGAAGRNDWYYSGDNTEDVKEITDVFDKPVELFADYQSNLVNIAAAFRSVLGEDDLEDVLDGLKQIAKNGDEAGNVATQLLKGMSSRSPLALKAMDKLMKEGKGSIESLESCAQREKKVLINLMERQDYKNWLGSTEGQPVEWKHSTIKDVTDDEVEELFAE